MNWSNTWTAVGAIAAAVTLLILVGSIIARRLKTMDVKNDLQLAKQRRIERDLFGEDPDNPNGRQGPTLREMVSEALMNTRGISDRMASAESRLGKVEDRQDLFDSRLADVEAHILRRPASN